MPSKALVELVAGIQEVRDLQRANPTPRGRVPKRPHIVRAINRSSVVLLYSHFERYLRSVNEEAVAEVNRTIAVSSPLPERLRLQHSKSAIELLADTEWTRREAQLGSFVDQEGWLWARVRKDDLRAPKLVDWMRSAEPKNVLRLFAMWGIPDIFSAITRAAHTRQHMWLKLTELVEKRHNIAHGDVSTEATRADVSDYVVVVRDFCERADRRLSRKVREYCGAFSGW